MVACDLYRYSFGHRFGSVYRFDREDALGQEQSGLSGRWADTCVARPRFYAFVVVDWRRQSFGGSGECIPERFRCVVAAGGRMVRAHSDCDHRRESPTVRTVYRARSAGSPL